MSIVIAGAEAQVSVLTRADVDAGHPACTALALAAEKAAQVAANAKAVQAGCPASTSARVNTLTWASAPAMTIDKSKTYFAHFNTTAGNFVIQGGDPTGTGTGGPGYTIADEYPKTATPQYPLYSLAMANEGSAHTGGSQFFIVTGSAGEQLGPTYSLFGEVVSGQSVVKVINAFGSPSGVPPNVTERMLTVTISQS